MEGWRRYLERNLNAQVAADDRAPSGNYTVRLRFKVDQLGVVHNVEPIAAPRLCPTCVKEAVRVIEFGPNWTPAVQFGKAAEYNATQNVTFQVSGDKF